METESTLSSYHIFNAVAEAGNLSKAAKSLYISQPAISRAVSKLEQALSVKLFIRGSRGVHLTEEGRLLYEHTKSAFDALRQGEENLRRINHLGLGQLRIGVTTALCKYILMPQVQKFLQEFPHIQVTVQCFSSSEVLKLLEDNRLDIGLISNPDSLHNIEFLPVTELEDTFVATEAYLKNLKIRSEEDFSLSDVSFEKNRRRTEKKASKTVLPLLKNGTLMLLAEDNHSHIDTFLETNHIEAGQILEVNSMDLIIDFSKVGLGIGCVTKEFVQKELDDQTLIELPLSFKPEKQRIGFIYKKTHMQASSVNKFIEYYKGGTR